MLGLVFFFCASRLETFEIIRQSEHRETTRLSILFLCMVLEVQGRGPGRILSQDGSGPHRSLMRRAFRTCAFLPLATTQNGKTSWRHKTYATCQGSLLNLLKVL